MSPHKKLIAVDFDGDLHEALDGYVRDQRDRIAGFDRVEKGILDGILTDLELMLGDHSERRSA